MTSNRSTIVQIVARIAMIVLFAASTSIHAGPAFDRKILPGQQQGAVQPAEKRADKRKPDRILPRAPRIDARAAASRVRKSYQDHRVLAINLIDGQGPPVYRVKTLSDKGVVRFVYVDGINGEVFE
ncbi:MAG: hypothetical protein CBC10_005415 [Gammaproteobacteria bacterium TMED50]|nr:MAG: hypothetical protein CBC10_005415 [Gammaproteobacteria bacterium TMED50]